LKWVTGPEGLANGGTGTTFWNGLANGSTTPPYTSYGSPSQISTMEPKKITLTLPHLVLVLQGLGMT
jgi:hypothetical protein